MEGRNKAVFTTSDKVYPYTFLQTHFFHRIVCGAIARVVMWDSFAILVNSFAAAYLSHTLSSTHTRESHIQSVAALAKST